MSALICAITYINSFQKDSFIVWPAINKFWKRIYTPNTLTSVHTLELNIIQQILYY